MTRETIAKFVDAFLADDAEECHKPEYENLAALVTKTYTESAWRTAMKRGAPEPPMQDRVGGIHRGKQCMAANVTVFVKQLDINGRCVTDINRFSCTSAHPPGAVGERKMRGGIRVSGDGSSLTVYGPGRL